HRMVRVVPHLGREIERHRQPGLPRGQQMAEPRVGLLRGAEPGVLAHGPELATIHGRMDAARERVRAGVAQLARGIARPVFRTVYGLAVAHCAVTAASAPMTRAANATSSRLPITSGVFWCRSSGTSSRMERQPSVARPPACSTTSASGAASYSRRSLPCG